MSVILFVAWVLWYCLIHLSFLCVLFICLFIVFLVCVCVCVCVFFTFSEICRFSLFDIVAIMCLASLCERTYVPLSVCLSVFLYV